MASRNHDERSPVNRYLWVAGAVGTGACVAYWLARKEDRWTRTKKQYRNLARAGKKQLQPLMSSAAESAGQGARFMKESLAAGTKKIGESAPEIKTGAVELLDAMSELWMHGRKLARSMQR